MAWYESKSLNKNLLKISDLITIMKTLLDSDWLRAVQLLSNTSAKSVIPVQEASYKCKLQIKILKSNLQSTGVRDWNVFKNLVKLRSYSKFVRGFPKFSEHFRTFRKISENLQKFLEDRFENFPTFSDFFRFFPKISEDFRQFPKI